MDEVVRYIFSNINRHDKFARKAARFIKNQKSFNAYMLFLTTLSLAYSAGKSSEIKELRTELDELKDNAAKGD